MIKHSISLYTVLIRHEKGGTYFITPSISGMGARKTASEAMLCPLRCTVITAVEYF